MQYVRKRVKCGEMLYIMEYAAPARGKNRHRPPAVSETSEAQAKLNERYAVQYLAWLILCNFTARKDMFVTLTHAGRITEGEARAKRKRFLARLRKHWKGKGEELRYIVVTEKQGYWHHHIITQETPLEVIRELWGKEEGRVMVSALDPSDDYQGLAQYLAGEKKPDKSKGKPKAPRRKGQPRYSRSHNLKEPEIEIQEIKRITKTAPRPPKGYIVKEWSLWADEWGELHKEYRCIWAGGGDSPPQKHKGRSGKQ